MYRLTIGLDWFLNPAHMPLIIGIKKGWFTEEQLEIEMIEPMDQFDSLDKIKAGEIDLAITEPVQLVENRADGVNILGFARFLHTNGGVMYLNGIGIKRPRDLIGKRIQYPGAPGLNGLAIVKTMVEQDGATCSYEDFYPVNNSFYHLDALESGQAEAAALIFHNIEITEASYKEFDVDYFALKDWGIPDFCQLILITTPQMLDVHKERLQKFVKVLRRSIDFIFEHPEEAKAIYLHYVGVDPEDALSHKTIDATISCFTYDFSMSNEYYSQLQTWVADVGKIKNTVNPDVFWTNQLSLL
ncbi:ABC transporter substrate-binding protein [Sporosarcina obsidiansis]|uniref:ABC transporter substrate-binding protein n=1 Tax=Sporosarcina obsidiansis TaxID=2660748 RepID=UPI00129A88A2|nr:ABC transporter substrate-binding protein [Sporosarcina obsidiansis]